MGRRIALLMLCLMLLLPGASLAADETTHWVYPELKEYKQMVAGYKETSSVQGPVTQEEWRSFHSNVLDAAKWDQPVQIYNWVTMIKMGIELPQGEEDRYLTGYIYDLVQMYDKDIVRQSAIGGLVKLLSASIVDASWNNTEADAAATFSDFAKIDERYSGLVRIAYRDGLLDSGTTDRFRPGDKLTNGEAVSIMYKVMKKYEQLQPLVQVPKGHWAQAEVEQLMKKHAFPRELQKQIQAALDANDRMTVSLWHELLASVLRFPPDKNGPDAVYTYGLVQDGVLSRDRAVAGLMKLWAPSRDATEAERQSAARAFSDYGKAFDQSKLAMAYSMGLVRGYGSEFAPLQELTCTEALVLLSRVAASPVTGRAATGNTVPPAGK
jgi:hypothetical protein